MKYKSDEESEPLFNEYKRIEHTVQFLGSIVQNSNIIITEDDLVNFSRMSQDFIKKLEELETKVSMYYLNRKVIEE